MLELGTSTLPRHGYLGLRKMALKLLHHPSSRFWNAAKYIFELCIYIILPFLLMCIETWSYSDLFIHLLHSFWLDQSKVVIRIGGLNHGGCTLLSSRTPRARQKNLLFLNCITKMGQNFINVFSWVDLHNIYYIGKMGNQIWLFVF